jgi:hypothetical protein
MYDTKVLMDDCHQHLQYLVTSYTKQVLLGVTNGLPTVQLFKVWSFIDIASASTR